MPALSMWSRRTALPSLSICWSRSCLAPRLPRPPLSRHVVSCQTAPLSPSASQDFGQANYEYIIKGWEGKVVRCEGGDQKWGLFRAAKAL